MKQLVLLFGCFALLCCAGTMNAQSAKIHRQVQKPVTPAHLLKPQLKQPLRTGLEAPQAEISVPPAQTSLRGAIAEEIAGTTTYDLQTNGGESSRLHAWPNGEVTAAWIFSSQSDGSGWPDRGTGYNSRSNWSNDIKPSARLETNLRTGFPNYVVTENNTELIIAHKGKTGGGYELHVLSRPSGASNWTESDIPTAVPTGELWSKAAVDGNTVHVIAITTLASLGGAPYKGVDGHLLYWRSKDAGQTWDVTDAVIPGLDSSAYAQISADKYVIDARDGIVAVGIFDSWNDAQIFKSQDGGDTWDAPFVLWDFPLHKYTVDQGYTTVDIGGADPNAPDSLAIFTTDGTASILLDVLGYVHAFVGETYVLDATLGDGTSSYYPGINGLIYWSEINPDSLFEITYSRDWNNNDTLDITGTITGYGSGLSSMPASASDDNGYIYLAYSSNVEGLNDVNDLNYRHIYTMKSFDFGQSWTDPVDVHYLAAAGQDSIIGDFSEGVWPMAYKHVTDKFHIIFQRDFTPGSSVQQGSTIEDGLSDMLYIGHGDIVKTNSPKAGTLELGLFPNPATQRAWLTFDLPQGAELRLEILDQTGRVRYSNSGLDLAAGQHTLPLELAGLSDGLYFVRLQGGAFAGVKKMLVTRGK